MSTLADVIQRGTFAARPAASIAGRLYYDTTNSILYRDSGAAWENVEAGGAGGPINLSIIDAKGDLIAGTAADTAARLAVGASNGMVLIVASGESTGLKWAWPPGHEFDYSEITADVTVSGTAETSAGSTLVVTGNAATYDGEPVMLEFFAPAWEPGLTTGNDVRLGLYESTTFLGRLALTQMGATGTNGDAKPLIGRYRFTPSAAAHTYLIRAMRTSANGTIRAGAAGATNYVPAYLRIIKA